ncbi:N-ethylmaleimide reductase [Candidatus Nitrotoga sp. BS]|uniref:alkene reductase n=1 Tax=Candidatus Nitrotoga sp. BS TaxID=2890408 RepID=UPI001F99694F|nr:alkene reductase [Candidatus Nitrotoga sp. BS]CAH1204553.1 N-ethylmaleimide reductase [Candidatus Nitrotoga sp. BS]
MANDDKLTPSKDDQTNPTIDKSSSRKDMPLIPMADWDIDDNPPLVPDYPDVPKALNENPNLVADPRNYPKKKPVKRETHPSGWTDMSHILPPEIHPLYKKAWLGALELNNRVVMAPMTRSRAALGNVPNAMNATYYSQRCGAGLIISEPTQVSDQGIGYPGTPGISTREQIDGWKLVTAHIRRTGGRIFMNLSHVGRISHPSLQPFQSVPVAPSAIQPAGEVFTPKGMEPFVVPRALEVAEMSSIAEQYKQAARNAEEAWLDGIEIDAANGYLLDQFLRDSTNQRTDEYGGSIENRSRLLFEVIKAVCSVYPSQKVGVRLSPVNPLNDISDSTPQETFEYVVEQLNRFDLAYIHVVEEHPSTFDFQRLRTLFRGKYIANGGYDAARAEAAIVGKTADFVSFGALFIANPDLPLRLRERRDYNAPDIATFYGGEAAGYIDYPSLSY